MSFQTAPGATSTTQQETAPLSLFAAETPSGVPRGWRIYFWPAGDPVRLRFWGVTADTAQTVDGCLVAPPTGLGTPEMRTDDRTHVQRDGVEFYEDFYNGRVIEFTVTVSNDQCPGCNSRQQAAKILRYWNRNCTQGWLLLVPDCHPNNELVADLIDPDPEVQMIQGPFMVRGRPRAADLIWERSDIGVGTFRMRFEAADHRLIAAQPGSTPTSFGSERCVDVPVNGPGVEFVNAGDLSTCLTITLTGPLSPNILLSLPGGGTVQYNGVVADGQQIEILTCAETARDLLTGEEPSGIVTVNDLEGGAVPPETSGTMTLTTGNPADTGTVEVCWEQSVIGA